MKRSNRESSFVLFSVGILLTVVMFLPLYYFSNEDGNLRRFFFKCWYIQASTTCLFWVAIFFVIFRYRNLKDEIRVLNNKISIEKLSTFTSKETKRLLDSIPDKYKYAISFHRMSELLNGYHHNEEVNRLNQELSRRDIEQIERGHLILNTLRQIIPIIGFLGTVFGLSRGMGSFPKLAASAANMTALKSSLKDFAGTLGIAFDTTLLALGYTVIVLLVVSLLRRVEESFVIEVDEKAKLLITKFKPYGR